MPITVRVRNFQSIRDATVVLDGFTVVTGPNNSGKTALMRAIRGVFTNAPPGPLIRHGTASLTVDLDFGDGNTIKWEKGWAKPNGKGKTINRYTVNGKLLANVGRGCPPEVLDMGVKPIKAGTDTLWPQVADQFKGTLFLVGSPGSVVAEAIADVDRVGTLSKALKLSESDRRGVNSTLKVRKKDQVTLTVELEAFLGLDAVGKRVATVNKAQDMASQVEAEVRMLTAFQIMHTGSFNMVKRLAGVTGVLIPVAPPELDHVVVDLGEAEDLHAQYQAQQAELAAVEGVQDVKVPTTESVAEAQGIRDELRDALAWNSRWCQADALALISEAAAKAAESQTFTKLSKVVKIQAALNFCQGQQASQSDLVDEIVGYEQEVSEHTTELAELQAEIKEILGGLEECPTCGQAMDHSHGETS